MPAIRAASSTLLPSGVLIVAPSTVMVTIFFAMDASLNSG